LNSAASLAQSIVQENIQHYLFGGRSTDVVYHDIFDLLLSSVDDSYFCHFQVLDQIKICGDILSPTKMPWIAELMSCGIVLSDINSTGHIELLIGADIAGKLLTGGLKVLDCGLVCVQTKLGWTLMGKQKDTLRRRSSTAVLVTTMLTTEAATSDLC
jgi:hypothetical protein